MKDFKDKVAVITGAASGIGYGIAKRAIKEGMKVVIADVEEDALVSAEDKLRNFGDKIIAVPTDVSKVDSLERLAQKTIDTFGKVHLLCNNAGFFTKGVLWEAPLAEWEWLVNVNLWGVIHGIRTFIPIMLKQNEDCHIVNTSSTAGLISPQFYEGIYDLTKHGVVSISEALSYELSALNSKIKVSVLCPGMVKTNLIESRRNSPKSILDREIDFKGSLEILLRAHPEAESTLNMWKGWWKRGISPEKVGHVVFNAIKDQAFYILTDTSLGLKKMLENRMKRILNAFEQNKKYV
ncbi:MAG: SDR family NAD(P)-dependent oxidoreductase [Candidatus Lokiarchaeota archaeon]|nr:SDR family NAD(P)-dependent oxidoreductase [Candidatus Lokiarchaeota archaeon]